MLRVGRVEAGVLTYPDLLQTSTIATQQSKNWSPVTTILLQSYTGLTLSCTRGYDGGMEQSFVLQIVSSLASVSQEPLPRLESHDRPVFHLENLNPGSRFKAVVFAKVSHKNKPHC